MRSLKGISKVKRNDLVEEATEFTKGTSEEMDILLIKRRTDRKKKIVTKEKVADKPSDIQSRSENMNAIIMH